MTPKQIEVKKRMLELLIERMYNYEKTWTNSPGPVISAYNDIRIAIDHLLEDIRSYEADNTGDTREGDTRE